MIVVIALNAPSRFFDSGNGPTKSIPIASQGLLGTGRGLSSPYGFWLVGLLRLQVMHVSQYFCTSGSSVFHQTCSRNKLDVL